MPHSENLRWIKGGTQAVHLNSKGAKKFDSAKSRALSIIDAHNRAIAKRDAGKTKEQMSNDAFKSGRTSGRY